MLRSMPPRSCSALPALGHRELNDVSAFDATSGLRVEARADFDADGERALLLAYQFDLTQAAALLAFGASL